MSFELPHSDLIVLCLLYNGNYYYRLVLSPLAKPRGKRAQMGAISWFCGRERFHLDTAHARGLSGEPTVRGCDHREGNSFIQIARPSAPVQHVHQHCFVACSQPMFIEELKRHLTVSSIPELPRLLDFDKNFWNVVSIREPKVPKPACLMNAKRYLEVFFEDREDLPDFASRPPRSEDVAVMFEFVDAHPEEPVLVHCLADQSRSPAFALGIIVRGLIQSGWDKDNTQSLVAHASDLLLQVRPQSRPNGLLLKLCFEQFLPEPLAKQLAVSFVRHPPLWENRTTSDPRGCPSTPGVSPRRLIHCP